MQSLAVRHETGVVGHDAHLTEVGDGGHVERQRASGCQRCGPAPRLTGGGRGEMRAESRHVSAAAPGGDVAVCRVPHEVGLAGLAGGDHRQPQQPRPLDQADEQAGLVAVHWRTDHAVGARQARQLRAHHDFGLLRGQHHMAAGLQAGPGRGGGGLRVSRGLQHGGRGQLRQQGRRVHDGHAALRLRAQRLWQVGADPHLRLVKPGILRRLAGALHVLVAYGGHLELLHAASLGHEGGAELACPYQPDTRRRPPGLQGKPLEDGFEVHASILAYNMLSMSNQAPVHRLMS